MIEPLILRALIPFLTFCLVGCFSNQNPIPPNVVSGVIDLRDWDFDKNGNVPLNGEWKIKWQQFEIKDTQSNTYTNIPGNWTNNFKSSYPNGYATLQIKILVNPKTKFLYLQNGVTRNAFKILIGDEVIYESGKIGTDTNSEIPNISIQTVSLPSILDGTIDINLQISCFHYHVCGVATPYLIGTHNGINKSFFEATSRDILVLASLGTLAFFHFVLLAG